MSNILKTSDLLCFSFDHIFLSRHECSGLNRLLANNIHLKQHHSHLHNALKQISYLSHQFLSTIDFLKDAREQRENCLPTSLQSTSLQALQWSLHATPATLRVGTSWFLHPTMGPMINHRFKSPLGHSENAPFQHCGGQKFVIQFFLENSFVAYTVGSTTTCATSFFPHAPPPSETNAHSEQWDVIQGQTPTTL